MTVRTAHNALLDFSLCLCPALSEGDTQALDATDVVEVEGTRVTKTAVNAPSACFIFAQPRSECCGPATFILSVARAALGFSALVVGTAILGIVGPVSGSAICRPDLLWITFPPSFRCLSLAPPFPIVIHNSIVAHNSYPCKPDIFDATYEPVEVDG